MTKNLVSVLIPVYNVEEFVTEAVLSILHQSYKELEIIIVDDCSTDNTFALVEKIASNDNRIKVHKNTTNRKIADTLNYAYSLSTGEFIARMDGDDISHPERIARKVAFLKENEEIMLVGCSMIAIDPLGNQIGMTQHFSKQKLLEKNLKFSIPVSHIWVARREVYEILQGYRNCSGVEDYDFMLRMKQYNLRFSNLEEFYGYFVRIGRKGNTITTMGLVQIKMRLLVYKAYKIGFSDEKFYREIEKIRQRKFTILDYLHKKSSQYLFLAIKNKGERKFINSFIYITLSLISPYQMWYLFSRVMIRINRLIYS